MPYETVYVIAVLVSSAIGLAVGLWLWSPDADGATKLFVATALLHPITGVLVVAELLAPTRSLSIAFYGAHSAVAGAVPVVWFLFTIAYTRNRPRLLRRLGAVVIGLYAVVALLEVTNPIHGLMWEDFQTITEPFRYYEGEPTGLFMLLGFPPTILYYAGMAVLGSHLLFGPKARRTQTTLLFVGFLPPFFVTPAWFAGLIPGPLNGALVVASPWLLALAAWAVFRHQLFDLAPLARETVFETIDEPVIVVDRDRRLLDHNRAAVETFPELDGAEGDPIESVIPALVEGGNGDGTVEDGGTIETVETIDAETVTVENSIVGDREPETTIEGVPDPFTREFTHHGAGEPTEYAVAVSALAVEGEVQGYGLVLRDVTERRKHLRDLEQKTAQLERFASTVSHDIRNPLNVAQGRLDLAAETGDEEHLERASDALDRIGGIVEDILTLTREGQTVDELEPVRLSAVVRKARETTDTKDATIEVDPDADIEVYADGTRLLNVFENLFRNAVEHAGPDATIRIGRHPDGFYVEDDGPGVAPEERDEVFEYEYTTSEGGTGLGLAIVESIARAHGWSVEMTEGSDGGARVVFSDVEVIGAPDGERSTLE